MTLFVLDSSVAVKWVLPEPGSAILHANSMLELPQVLSQQEQTTQELRKTARNGGD